jgi:hypothetical protein
MTTTTEPTPASAAHRAGRTTPVAVGTVLGAAGVGCCSVGIASGIAVGVGVGTGFFSLGQMSPVGDQPILFFGALLVTVAVAWAVARWQTRALPAAAATPAVRRVVAAGAITAAGSWFVMMQIVVPVMFILGWADMGQWFPK